MRVVVQRVNNAKLESGEYSSSIGYGLLATVGVSKYDTLSDIEYLAKKIANMRLFKDEDNKMNLSLLDVEGDIMIVSNFTLQANIKSGTRPDFSRCAEGGIAEDYYLKFAEEFRKLGVKNVALGSFGNHMHNSCQLDGPFTIVIDSEGR